MRTEKHILDKKYHNGNWEIKHFVMGIGRNIIKLEWEDTLDWE